MRVLKDEVIKQLQEALLTALLSNQPLLGSNKPLEFPDLALILRQAAVPILDENLAKPISAEALPKPARVLSLESLAEEARTRGNLTYLRFQPAEEVAPDVVRLTLQGGITTGEPRQHALGLGGIQVKMQKIDDQWRTIDEPVVFAT